MSSAFQYGLDLTISLSVIGALIAYWMTTRSAMRQRRVETLSKTIEKFSEFLDEGSRIISSIRQMKANAEDEEQTSESNGTSHSARCFLNYFQKLVHDVQADKDSQSSISAEEYLEHFQKLVRDAQKNESQQSSITPGVLLDYCQKIVRYIDVNNSVSFEIWATKEEKKIIENIRQLAETYNNNWVEFLENKDSKKDVLDFEVFQENFTKNVKDLSTCLRKQIIGWAWIRWILTRTDG